MYKDNQTHEEIERDQVENFYRTVDQVISERVTPIYNTFILMFAAVFSYYSLAPQN